MAKRSITIVSVVVAIAGLLATIAVSGTPKNKPSNSGWSDDFTEASLSSNFWVINNGQAPGYIPDEHIGYYLPGNVSLTNNACNGCLVLTLTQQTGTVGTNTSGVISNGAEVYTRKTYGYGTYTWRMRMSSTALTPDGAGGSVSGSVSAGFLYVNNSETEIDWEFSALAPGSIFAVNWLNPNPSQNPPGSSETYTELSLSDVSNVFHTYSFVWQAGSITYFIDGQQVAQHTTNVPSAPAHFVMNHWGTDSTHWGGPATVGVTRYFYIDSVSYKP
jgi:beta-glucanase (GH16 family)